MNPPLKKAIALFLTTAFFIAPQSFASVDQLQIDSENYETKLLSCLTEIQEKEMDNALNTVSNLVEENPKFKLAQLIYADLLYAKAGPIKDIGNHFDGVPNEEILGLRDEAQKRWQHYNHAPNPTLIPSAFVQLSDDIKFAIAVDLSASRLYFYQHNKGQLTLLNDYYVSIGKNGAIKQAQGDKRTPIGVYHTKEFLSPDELELPELYGAGAFPINYPNALDKRQGKTGWGIWLHGTPKETYSRPPRASDGCVTMSNSNLETIKPLLLDSNALVVISESIKWNEPNTTDKEISAVETLVENWRADWESLDIEKHLKHYSKTFSFKKKDYEAWSERKRRIAKTKTFIDVEVRKISIFNYPGRDDLKLVSFEQDYKSNNYTNITQKHQYWQREKDGVWRIIYEGPA